MKNAFENTIIDYLPYIDHLAYINEIYENGMVDIVNQQADLVAEQVRYSILKVTVHSRCFYIELNKKHTDSVEFKTPIGYKFIFVSTKGEDEIGYAGVKMYPVKNIFISNFYSRCDKKVQNAIESRLLEIGKEQFTMYKLMEK